MAASILLVLICVSCAVLKKSYQHIAVSENGQADLSKELRLSLKHLSFLNILLDFISLAALALFVIGASFTFDVTGAFLIVLASLVIVFILIPNLKVSGISLKFAIFMAKPLAYVLKNLERPITKFEKLITRTNRKFHKTEPLSKHALLELLKEQKTVARPEVQTDLDLALGGLELNQLKAGYLMVKKQRAKIVDSDDLVGPILLSELHDAGRKIFPAKDKDGEIIGTIKLNSLTELKSGGKVKKVLNKQVVKIEKNEPALQALREFIGQGCELLIVEEEGKTAGFIYLEDVLKTFFTEEQSTA